MASSMLSGDRRWASSRRGGMTVLGKVAVPKPINLPSQRLENQGLDPNVEIVPKGTLSWGSKSPSSTSNAWGSSSLSPKVNSGASSPSHLSARPSSGGSGTRPSSSGSDKAPELTTNAWGSNSRPSSASGKLTSNQTSPTSLRPRSAETRPGSSHLSRFAEHVIENSGTWNASRTTERLGITQCKNDDFSLSSGDFPTLSSEKDKSIHNFELQEQSSHTRPGSSSGHEKENIKTSAVEDVPVNANVKSETENSWRRDFQSYNEDGMRPGIEKWQGSLQPHSNAGIPPHNFDAWHGGPVNNHQGDVWFRGPPNGPAFANPVAPGGFPIEPFSYYRPHIPPNGLANPPEVPPPGTGQRGHLKHGEVYRPHMHDAYVHPVIPLRPGFYPGPMAYEGYYSPPMGYYNSNERDVPFKGMASGPSVYHRYSNQNPPELGNSPGRSGGHGPAGKPLASELVESNHAPDTAGPYRVLLKQHSACDGKNEPTNWEDSVTTNESSVNVKDQQRVSVKENDHRRNEETNLRRTWAHGEEASFQTSRSRGSSSVISARSLESTGCVDKIENILERKRDDVASNALEIPSRPCAPKESTLIQKIEGLNAKARGTSSTKSKEEQMNKFHAVNHVENDISSAIEATHATEVINPTAHVESAFGGEKNFESSSLGGTATSRRLARGMQGRGNHRKGRLNNQDADGWKKKSGVIDSSSSSGNQFEASNILVGDLQISIDAYERSGSYSEVRRDREPMQTLSDSTDGHAQRAKIKGSAKHQTKQLREEEDRTRKQNPKALAKLDEFNRHSQAVEASMQKEYPSDSAPQNKQEKFDTNFNNVDKPPLSSEPPLEILKNAGKEPLLNHNQSVTLNPNVNCVDASKALQGHNNVASKQKRGGYKEKQNLSVEKTSNEKVVSASSPTLKVENDSMACVTVSSGIVTNEVASGCVSGKPINSNSMAEASVNQKKKSNRNSKSKQRVEETTLDALPSAIPKEAILSRSSAVNKPKEDIEFDQGSLESAPSSKDSNQCSEQRYLANEESCGRMNSKLKSQHSRRMPRNLQATRQAEKSYGSDVMWAPVKQQNKIEILDESSEKSKIDVIIPVKSDQQVHNLKSKRAEMERYIPKPVAKEMTQQGSVQQTVSSISQVSTDVSVERVDSGSQAPQITQHTNSAVGKAGSGMESKTGDGRQTKTRQGKTQGSWRQRNPRKSNDGHDLQDVVNHGSNSYQNIQIPTECQHAQMSETSLLKGQTKHGNDSGEPDGSNNPDNYDSVTVKERHASFRGKKGKGVNYDVDQKNVGDTGKAETLFPSEHGQPDVCAAFKENRSFGEQTSHWQPKYQASNNQRGNRPNDQRAIGVKYKESTPHAGVSLPDGCDKEANAHLAQPSFNQSVSERSKGGEAQGLGNKETKRERRNAPPKGRPHSPNQVAVSSSEQAPTSIDPGHQQHPQSGFRKNGNQNRFGKGLEFQGEWKSHAQDNRLHNQPTNWERQGPDLQYEYHPVGPHDDSKPDNSGRPKDGNSYPRGRFKERGQTHTRRGGGNFSAR